MSDDVLRLDTFERWVAAAFPWLLSVGPDYRNLRAAWLDGYEAGKKAAKEGRDDEA